VVADHGESWEWRTPITINDNYTVSEKMSLL